MPVQRDDSGFPYIRIRPVGASHDFEIVENLAFLERVLERREPFTVLFDSREGSSLSFAQRRMYVTWFMRHEDMLTQYCRGGVTVSSSPVVQAAIRTIFWVYPPPFAFLVTRDLDEGEAWLRTRLASTEVHAP